MTLVASDSHLSTLTAERGQLNGEQAQKFVLTLSCVEQPGIVQAVTTFLFDRGFNIEEHQQFDDSLRQTLHLRTAFSGSQSFSPERLEDEFASIAERFDMKFSFHDETKPRVLVMVSKFGHCLNDLIFRWRGGSLGGELVAVVSNHETHRAMAEAAGLPFIHVPVTPDTKAEAEQKLLDLVDEYQADLVVLARYMQVLSDDLCRKLEGRAINIHHSFLPGFKGARPYHQAYDRGVKQVGATAHYVTADLDEGPIIEQEVIRVDHSYGPTALSTVGQDAEALALSRAVRWHCEHRVLLDQTSTVVFR
ncbi:MULTISPECIES: formyltetrahydrofolate deformylase [Paenarthrobacter]|uniref:formyltetrahydrofolate deformylase n=1 Tax=Paenarthrobacter TaxID=1742992 RepID=UPI002366FB1E|nr:MULTISPECIES: formyltetrahydrofolate deformylase [Paenarthrobacter]MDD7834724.1 formyltetrahydrofolate deformylase [Paenarthrobacter sp. AB444]MDP9936337.1 formyltetrahydrofolate deformylase [Paenarthrobacter nicotinovorans]